jgi:mRNA interferase RelE/StbE
LTTYRLEFLPSARKAWEKLGATLRGQFKTKLAERLEPPRVPADALRRMANHFKSKPRSAGGTGSSIAWMTRPWS